LKHLTPEEIERLAEDREEVSPDVASDGQARHAAQCARCRDEVDAARALLRSLEDLTELSPSHGFAEAVMADVDLPIPWLDDRLAALPELSPSLAFSSAVMSRVDLPVPLLERAFAHLPHVVPPPGFATGVMARVRLPIPWHARLWRFARRRRIALAGAAASTLATTGAGAMWLFGSQGVRPVQLVTYLLAGLQDLAVRGLVTVGRIGYALGLVDAGTTIPGISPATALGGLALASTIGLLSLWVMARLTPDRPQPLRLRPAP